MALTKATYSMIEGAPVNVLDFGADPTGVADSTAAIQAAIDASDIVVFPKGTYRIDSQIVCDHDIIIYGEGSTITSSVAAGSLNFYGAIAATIPITATIASSTQTITATNSFSTGDLVVIRDDTDYSFSLHRTYYKRGEAHEVVSATGSNFNIPGAIWSYTSTTNLSVAKITPIKVIVRDLTIQNTAASDFVFRVQFGRDCLFENISVTGGVNRAFVLDRCFRSELSSSKFIHRGDPAPGLNYGLALSASHHTYVVGCTIHGTRHATGLGAGNNSGDVPSAFNTFDKCVFTNDPTTGLYCTDIHGDAYETTYKNSTIYGPICLGGENCYYLNNYIKLNQNAITLQVIEMVGGEVVIDNNIIDASALSATYNNVFGATNSATVDDISFDINFTITNNTVSLSSNHTIFASVLVNTAAATWNMSLENNAFRNDCSSLARIISYARTGSGKIPRWIRIKDFNTHSTMNLSTLEFFVIGSGVATGCRLTLPKVNKTVTLTSSAGSYFVAQAMTFGVAYGSVVPRVRAAIQNNAVQGPGYQFSVTESVTSTGCTVVVTTGNSGSNIGAVYAYEVDVEAGLNDYVI